MYSAANTVLRINLWWFFFVLFVLGGLYDITESYDLSFYLAGFFIALSGFLLFVHPIIKRMARYRRSKKLLNSHKNKIISITSNCKK